MVFLFESRDAQYSQISFGGKSPVSERIHSLPSPVKLVLLRYGGFALKEIPLTQGKTALVDELDYDFLMQWKWSTYYQPRAHTWYAVRSVRVAGRRTSIQMHRVITDAPDGMEVDHQNHDGLDNQRGNLRVCTRADNQHNQRPCLNNTSGYKGVSRRRGRWVAGIRCDGRRYNLGHFDTAEEAALAYNEAAARLHGEFAFLNDVRLQ